MNSFELIEQCIKDKILIRPASEKRSPKELAEKYFLNGAYVPIGWSARDVLEVFYPEECRIENDDKLIEAAKKFAEVLRERNYLNGVR